MILVNSTREDITEIFRLYGLATAFQKKRFPDAVWPEFDKAMVEKEISENRQFKLLIDNQVACVWAITDRDPQIWEEKDNDYSVYIHRIATNPIFRGKDFVKVIVEWARDFAKENNRQYIRLDTCGNNRKLISHYTKFGFDFLGIKKLKDPSGLPAHYQGADVCFFEMKLNV